METLLEMEVPPVIKAWRERLASAGAKYVMVQTTKVIHDRAAVVEESPENITVEYPARKGDYDTGWLKECQDKLGDTTNVKLGK